MSFSDPEDLATTPMESEIDVIEISDSLDSDHDDDDDDDDNNSNESSSSSTEFEIDELADSDNESIDSDFGTTELIDGPMSKDEPFSPCDESIEQAQVTPISTQNHSHFYNADTSTYYPSTGIRPIHPEYILCAHEQPETLPTAQTILVILDLNGAMVHRRPGIGKKSGVVRRPHLDTFIQCLLQNFRVMIWSSARPPTVKKLVEQFPGGTKKKLDRIWSREDMRLAEQDYHRKVLTLKDLDFVWDVAETEREKFLEETRDNKSKEGIKKHDLRKFESRFDQRNTVLIDDSIHKTQLQPYNSIILRDYDSSLPDADQDYELLKVRDYLIDLLPQANVSSYMRANPFDSSSERYHGPEFQARVYAQDRRMEAGGWRHPTREKEHQRQPKPRKKNYSSLEDQVADYQDMLATDRKSLGKAARSTLSRRLRAQEDSLKAQGVDISTVTPRKREEREAEEDQERNDKSDDGIQSSSSIPAAGGSSGGKPLLNHKVARALRRKLLRKKHKSGLRKQSLKTGAVSHDNNSIGDVELVSDDITMLSSDQSREGNQRRAVGDILRDADIVLPANQPLNGGGKSRRMNVGDVVIDLEPQVGGSILDDEQRPHKRQRRRHPNKK
ncbi:hypothetical protein BGZ83_009233 [Gryganskiella cystojenkinii]|nr:hypothetical protein BGZ83_009233 [Gryganskiella cystojenkinii]